MPALFLGARYNIWSREVQYGGKITDSVDRRMFNTYAEEFLNPKVCEEGFSYTPANPVMPIPQNYKYTVPGHMELKPFKDYIETFPEADSPEIRDSIRMPN